MFNKIKAKASAAKAQVQEFITNKEAMSQTTEIVLLIVLVVAVIGAFFAPAITEWFSDVMSTLGTHTDELFAIAPTT